MTFKQFSEKVVAIANQYVTNRTSQWVAPLTGTSILKVTRDCYLEGEAVEVGGITAKGWSSDSSTPYTVLHGEVEVDCLVDILSNLCPNITFLQYKKLNREMKPEMREFTDEGGYYGHPVHYQQKVVKLGYLYDALVTIGILEEGTST